MRWPPGPDKRPAASRPVARAWLESSQSGGTGARVNGRAHWLIRELSVVEAPGGAATRQRFSELTRVALFLVKLLMGRPFDALTDSTQVRRRARKSTRSWRHFGGAGNDELRVPAPPRSRGASWQQRPLMIWTRSRTTRRHRSDARVRRAPDYHPLGRSSICVQPRWRQTTTSLA
jgi:hypothetical protein